MFSGRTNFRFGLLLEHRGENDSQDGGLFSFRHGPGEIKAGGLNSIILRWRKVVVGWSGAGPLECQGSWRSGRSSKFRLVVGSPALCSM